MKRKLAALLLLASLRMLSAQEDSSAKDQKEPPKIDTVKTTVVVTATRDEVSPEKAPVSTSVVTMEENKMRNIMSLDQGLNLLNGIYVMRYSQSGQMNSVMMRGFNGTTRTLVLLDGQPLNDGYNSGVSWISLPVGEVDRMEVARGSFSSLYGGSAMGGVINILTRPITRREVEAEALYGANNTTEYSARVADQFFRKLAVSTAINRYQTQGYPANLATVSPATGTTGTFVTGAIPTLSSAGNANYLIGDDGHAWTWQEALRAKAEYSFNSNTVANFQYIRQQNGYGWGTPNSYLRDAACNVVTQGPVLVTANGKTVQLNLTPTTFLATPGDAHSSWYNGSFQHLFNDQLTLRVSGGLLDVPLSQYVSAGMGATPAAGPGTLNITNSHNYWGEIQNNWRVSPSNSLVFGTETRQARAGSNKFGLSNWTDYSTRLSQTYNANGQTVNQAVYIQDQYQLAEALTITAGMRYDYWKAYDGMTNGYSTSTPLTYYPEKTSNSGTGKLSVVYSLPWAWTVHASAGTSFRPPMVYELYQSTMLMGSLYNANPNLTPEKMISGEVGVRKHVGSRFDVDATYYHNHISNLIYNSLVATTPVQTHMYLNAAASNTDGIEFSSDARLLPWLQFKNSYTYTEAVIASNPSAIASVGKRVTNIPKHMGSGGLFAVRGPWSGTLTARYVGSTFSTDANTDTTRGVYGSYGPYFLLDGSAAYQVTKHWQAVLNAENLLDRTYYVYYRQPGRIASFGLRFRM